MEIEERQVGDVIILELSGRFEVSTANHAFNRIDEMTWTAPARLVVNLANVSFIDSTGLSVLVEGAKLAQEKGGNLFLCELQQPVRIIFELTRLDQYFYIYPAEDDALAAFAATMTSGKDP